MHIDTTAKHAQPHPTPDDVEAALATTSRAPDEKVRRPSVRRLLGFVAVAGVAVAASGYWYLSRKPAEAPVPAAANAQQHKTANAFRPTPSQWATLVVKPVELIDFQPTVTTEGKIGIDEGRSTPVFSPFAGRITKLLVEPGDTVAAGQPLAVIEAADSVQAQNDFMTALAAVNKAQSQLNLTQTVEKRMHALYDAKSMALKDWQQAQADLTAATNDLRSAQTTLEAARNRLRLIGKTDAEIDLFRDKGVITPAAHVFAPLAGTVLQRKAGPGQYIVAGSADPIFVIGDLSEVWLTAYVREADAPKLKVGLRISFTVLAAPHETLSGTLTYVGTNLDPASRRLLVRATIDNGSRMLKPEMFASVSISTGAAIKSAAVPREAVIYEGDTARVWIVRGDRELMLRPIRTGLTQGRYVQVIEGLEPSDRVVTRGSLFIDRAGADS